jgi:hypothetical protein
MKKIILPLVVLTTFMVSSCEVTVGDKSKDKDGKNEVKNGFSYGKKDIKINKTFTVKNNLIYAGETLTFEFSDVQNATLKDNFQHVGIEITIKKENGEIIDHSDDLLGNIEQQDPKLDFFNAYFTVPSDVKEGEKIVVDLRLFDKYGEISYDFSDVYTITKEIFKGTENVDIKTNIENIELSVQLKMDRKQFKEAPIQVKNGDELLINVNGVKDFNTKDGVVFIDYILEVEDAQGKIVFSKEDIIKGPVDNYETYPIYFTKDFYDYEDGSYVFSIFLKDHKSDKKVDISFPIKF